MLTSIPRGEPPVILIAGPARCGKSLFAAALADAIGARVICFDEAREKSYAVPPGRLRKIARASACLKAIKSHQQSHGTPLIVEGANLISRRAKSAQASLQLLLFLRGYIHCHAFTLGCGDTSVEEKAEAIMRYTLDHKDWLYAEADGRPAAIRQLARQWAARAVEESRKVKASSEQCGIMHLSLRSAHFAEDLNKALQAALDQLAAPAEAAS